VLGKILQKQVSCFLQLPSTCCLSLVQQISVIAGWKRWWSGQPGRCPRQRNVPFVSRLCRVLIFAHKVHVEMGCLSRDVSSLGKPLPCPDHRLWPLGRDEFKILMAARTIPPSPDPGAALSTAMPLTQSIVWHWGPNHTLGGEVIFACFEGVTG